MTAMAETTDPGAARARDRGRLRIVVLGYLVRGPLGGRAWHVLQYVLGLHKMGHEVYFLEDSDDQPWACYDPARNTTDGDPSYGLRFVSKAFAEDSPPGSALGSGGTPGRFGWPEELFTDSRENWRSDRAHAALPGGPKTERL